MSKLLHNSILIKSHLNYHLHNLASLAGLLNSSSQARPPKLVLLLSRLVVRPFTFSPSHFHSLSRDVFRQFILVAISQSHFIPHAVALMVVVFIILCSRAHFNLRMYLLRCGELCNYIPTEFRSSNFCLFQWNTTSYTHTQHTYMANEISFRPFIYMLISN